MVDSGVKHGDVVGIWGAGPIGQLCADFSFMHGASRVIMIDGEAGAWRLSFVQTRLPRVETLDYSTLDGKETVPSALRKLSSHGLDVALECASGEYSKSWSHYLEQKVGAENDTSEIVNEMIESVRDFGRCGITGVYSGFVSYHECMYLDELLTALHPDKPF